MSVYFAINSVFVLGKKRKLSQIILSPNYLKKKEKQQPGMALSSSFNLIRNFYNILV